MSTFIYVKMKLVFITNYVHHHQIPLADEFYKMLGDGYKYVATDALPGWLIKGGYDPSINRPYVVRAYEGEDAKLMAMQLVNDAEVVIIGSAPEDYVRERIKAGKLTFRYSERWFKNKLWYLSGPRAWYNFWHDHIQYRNKPLYMLAASAYTCRDVNNIGAYKNKVFKWGYFTKVEDFPLEASANFGASSEGNEAHLMWCARFLRLKHPELPVKLARRLKDRKYKFVIDMYGSGEELEPTRELSRKLDVTDVVRFKGNLPNDEILKQMRHHQIFLFTSDKNEGWGAVLNESMSNGCAVVASNMIGSVPFLINDGVNGLIFKSVDLDSLETKVVSLLDSVDYRRTIAGNAIKTMREVWCPKNAALQFLRLVDALKANDIDSIPIDGPCSLAPRI